MANGKYYITTRYGTGESHRYEAEATSHDAAVQEAREAYHAGDDITSVTLRFVGAVTGESIGIAMLAGGVLACASTPEGWQ